ncbi:MAG: helix-turn-helix domain-containing protein, partial [Lachnospiraceae bacterium]
MVRLNTEKLSQIVQEKRKEKGLTQKALSEATGINRTMISHIEENRYVPSLPQLTALSNALSFDPGEVFETEEEK